MTSGLLRIHTAQRASIDGSAVKPVAQYPEGYSKGNVIDPVVAQFAPDAARFLMEINSYGAVMVVVDELLRLLKRFGVETVSFCSIPNLRQTLADVLFVTRGADEWLAEYVHNNYVRSDPVVTKIRSTSRPFMWSDISVDPRFVDGAHVMKRRRERGYLEGFVVPIHNHTGTPGGVSMSGMCMHIPLSIHHFVRLMAICAFERICDIRFPHASKPPLSPRECEVMALTARGKMIGEVASVLGISERTVETHLRHAVWKLSARNRTHAVAIAVRQHFIPD